MSHALYKDANVIGYTPGVAGVPADPGQVYVPGYTSYDWVQVCGFQTTTIGNGQYIYVQDPSSGAWSYIFVPTTNPDLLVTTTYSWGCAMQWMPVYHPAVEAREPTPGVAATAAQTTYDFNLGWNAGARSNGFVLNDGYVQFKVPASLVGGVLGLNNVDADASYGNIEHAIYLSGDVARVYESGAQAYLIGAYVGGDTFKITRVGGVVKFYQNGSLAYTSATPSTDTFFLDASLYAGGDFVYDPVIADISSINGSMLPLVGIGGDKVFAQSEGQMLPLTGTGGILSRGAGSMLPLVGLGSDKHTTLTVWPAGVYPVSSNGSVIGVVTGGMFGGDLVNGAFAGALYDVNGVLIGDVQATATGTDPGTGFTGEYTGAIIDHTTGAVIGYVAGTLSGTGAGTLSYAANATGSANYVLIPSGATTTTVSVTGDIAGAVAGDGAFTGTYTGVIVSPVTGNIIGTFTATITGAVDEFGNLAGTYVGVVTDPITGEIIGLIVGAVSNTGTLDGSSFTDTGVTSTGSFIPTAAPTTIIVSTYGDSHGALQPLTGTGGTSLPPPVYALGAGALAILIGGAHGLTGEVGESAGAMLPLEGGISSDHPYGESRGTLLPMIGYGSAYEGNLNASIGNLAITLAPIDTQSVLVVVMDSAGVISDVMSLAITVDGSLQTDLVTATTLTLTALLNAVMQTNVSVGAVVPQFEQDHVVYVVNTDTNASSTYESYPFNSYGLLDGVYFGLKGDGLYRLDGYDDAGTPIQASVSYGKQDFGSLFKKRMTAAYVGVSSTDKVFLKITTPDGVEYIYAARRNDDHLRAQRIDVGRGIEASYLTFELFNKDGAEFELASVEFHAAEMTRRI